MTGRSAFRLEGLAALHALDLDDLHAVVKRFFGERLLFLHFVPHAPDVFLRELFPGTGVGDGNDLAFLVGGYCEWTLVFWHVPLLSLSQFC